MNELITNTAAVLTALNSLIGLTLAFRLGVSTGAHPDRKITSIVAGMIAGADCVNDLDLLRHGGMSRVFTAISAPSTLGSFLRSFSWGDTRALESVARSFLSRLAAATPLLPGADQIAYVDVDSLLRRTFDTAKQGCRVRARQSRWL